MTKPLVFCLTPVKNEAWILERFLKCASLWADHIIIADQGSTDGSREIARKFPKVRLIDNCSKNFNEPERQKLLLAEARRVSGPKILFAVDADEFLTANVLTSREWQSILAAQQGTVIRLQWPAIQVNHSDLTFFHYPALLPIGFVDDESEHTGKVIHSTRVPIPLGAPELLLTDIKLMHYCLMDVERFNSRIRWYQCFEYLTSKKKAISLYRFYNVIRFVPSQAVAQVPWEWIEGYAEHGIDMTSVNRKGTYHWDREVLEHFKIYGPKKFRRLPIWDVDWVRLRNELFPGELLWDVSDPRSKFDKLVHKWLKMSQPDFSLYAQPKLGRRLFHKLVNKVFSVLGW